MSNQQKEQLVRELAQKAFNESRADYLEIRFEERDALSITYRGKKLDEVSQNSSNGGFIRALVKGGWGYASFTDIKEIPSLARKAENAGRLISRGKDEFAPIEIHKDCIDSKYNDSVKNIPIDEKENLVRHYNDIILNTNKVQTSGVIYQELDNSKILLTSEGTDISEKKIDLNLIFTSIAREGDLIEMGLGMKHSYNDFNKLKDLDKKIQEVADRSVSLLKAKTPKAGKFDIVADQRLSGVFAHEAFGHLSEADFTSENENLCNIMKIGRQFGSKDLNIIDDGSVEDLPGCYKYDDEGVKMQKTYLIKEGKLSGRLHNRETAAKMKEKPSGNARAVSFFNQPIVRMTCTYVDKGDWNYKDMIRDIDDGYYVKSSKGGQTNLEQFTFSGEEAYRIKDGEITHQVRDLNISGNLFETLHDIDAIGNDLKLMVGGYCGKGEHYPLPVSYGGPHIRIRNVVVGGG